MSKKKNSLMILKIFKRIIVSFSLFSLSTQAINVTHSIKPGNGFHTSSLQNSCSTFLGTSFSSECNIALFPLSPKNGIFISGVAKSDGDSIDNGRDLIFDPITLELLRNLFQNSNYNSFSFNSRVSFSNELFEISYSPYYLLADLYLFNPAFPEISLSLVNRETLSLSSGFLLFGKKAPESFKISTGARLSYYSHESANSLFSLFDLSNQNPESLILFNTQYGLQLDLSFFVDLGNDFLPDFSFQFKNLGSRIKVNEASAISATRLSPRLLFEPFSQFGIGKKIDTPFGAFSLNLENYILDVNQQIDWDRSAFGVYYTLNLFSIYGSLSKFYKIVGISFRSELFDVGVSYNSEKDIGNFQQGYENSAYIGVDISI